jgi:uracil-DNA glycosylase family 4
MEGNLDEGKPPSRHDLSISDATVAIRWWSEAGVEFAIDEAPRNHFAEGRVAPPAFDPATRPAKPAGPPVVSPAPWSAPGGEQPAEIAARDLAASAPDLTTLRARLEAFEGCGLKRTATQLVFADGTPGSRVMFVGEAPGGDEDRVGRPFVGRAGQLLDRMLKSIALDRGQVYIANVVPWRPPGNRTPTLQETQACLPFIKRQIELAAPQILVCLGASSAQTLLGIREGITRARGTWVSYHCDNGRTLRALAMLHPAFLLRQPGQKRQAWTDLRALAKELQG